MTPEDSGNGPMINCHTHIFTGESVPPYIAKTFIPWPLYYLFSVPFILRVFRFWFLSPLCPRQWKYQWWYKKIQRIIYAYRSFTGRNAVAGILVFFINLIIIYHTLIYLAQWLLTFFIKPDSDSANKVVMAAQWLQDHRLLWMPSSGFIKLLVFLFTLFFIAQGRKLIFFLFKKTWSFLSILPDKTTLQFIARYINIGRFAYYKSQGRVFIKLKDQYPAGTGFVLLPMDMEFINAGPLKADGRFDQQMRELAIIKRNPRYKDLVYPFVFVDPRRKQVGNQVFLDWKINAPGEVVLNDCFIKDYIEKEKFSGFKIYPALGYYPFDEALLPLWKYAADRQLPILTHCIRGTIYYRGTKKKEWGYHPVFRESDGPGVKGPLLLPQLKNVDYINNFTHPLNYLCLTEEKLLRILVARAGKEVKELFGFTDESTPLKYNLQHLKLCFGHFGGQDEWQRYFEKDRDDFTSQLVRKPDQGIVFIKDGPIENSYNALEMVWNHVDWYSIIRSMLLQYDHLYADISYIVHDETIFPLLVQTMQHEKLKTRVLFGTDFYVVRNHKSEKEMLAGLQFALSDEALKWMTAVNPVEFLKRV